MQVHTPKHFMVLKGFGEAPDGDDGFAVCPGGGVFLMRPDAGVDGRGGGKVGVVFFVHMFYNRSVIWAASISMIKTASEEATTALLAAMPTLSVPRRALYPL